MTHRSTTPNAGLGPRGQDRLIQFLLKPSSYPHRPRQVRLIQTHASLVFIAPPLVFKVKKPVDFGFLNFSTLALRRHFCEREVALNRRLAPDVYLGVVPIRLQRGQLGFGEEGELAEYAVKMRLLSNRDFLDQRLQRGEVTRRDLDRVTRVLKEFYTRQRPTREVEEWGRIERLRISTDENFRQIRRFVGGGAGRSGRPSAAGDTAPESTPGTLSPTAYKILRFYAGEFYRRHAPLFRARVREKRIRDCHGDLHAEHIHLTRRGINIFDCIEFNDRFRFVDVANDAAFLAMDLDFEGSPEFARYFARRISGALDDPGMLQLMDFYKGYRAIVRGKVESLHAIAASAPALERRAAADRARRYFRLALQYAATGSQPTALIVMGRIASGKSTLARALGAELGWKVLSSDVIRKDLAGVALHRRGTVAARSRLYSEAMTDRTYRRLRELAEGELGAGRSVILDATFSRAVQRAMIIRAVIQRKAQWRVIEAAVSDAQIQRRLRDRASQPGEVSDARLEDFAKLTARYEPPTELPAARLTRIQTSNKIERTLVDVLKRLAQVQVDSAALST